VPPIGTRGDNVPVGCATVNETSEATSPHSAPRLRRRAKLLSLPALLAAGVLIAGCGSSSSGSETITIGNENKADQKLITAEDPQVPKTPTTGPLATKPTIEGGGTKPTKLESKDIVVGTGPEAKNGKTIYVNYVGALWNGKEFDSSWKRNEPFVFVPGTAEVINGWDKGVIGMKVGGRRELRIPAELAYGKLGNAPKIPKNEPLKFVIDLLKVNKKGEG
jgi:peptidylprolyl isomerase